MRELRSVRFGVLESLAFELSFEGRIEAEITWDNVGAVKRVKQHFYTSRHQIVHYSLLYENDSYYESGVSISHCCTSDIVSGCDSPPTKIMLDFKTFR